MNLRLYSALSVLCVVLHTLGAPHCLMHNASPASTVIHLLGGLDGTGGLSIIGVLARDVSGATPQWIVIHVVDNHQVRAIADSEFFVAYKVATPLVWSPMWYTQSSSMRRMPRQLGTQIIQSHILDPLGEYLISASTEEWEQAAFRTWRSSHGGGKLKLVALNNDDFAEHACSTAPYHA